MDTDIFNLFSSSYQSFLNSNFLYYVKIVSAFVSTLLLMDIILLMNKRIRTDWRISVYGAPTKRFKKSVYQPKWDEIKKRLEEKSVAGGKIALIEADKMLGEALAVLKYQGRDTTEKIEQVPAGRIVGITEAKDAHNLSKMIISDPTYEIEFEQVKSAFSAYERVFRGIGMID